MYVISCDVVARSAKGVAVGVAVAVLSGATDNVVAADELLYEPSPAKEAIIL
jgi:hypothetical protein